MRYWRKSKLFGGYWGWFWSPRTKRLMLAFNEGGNEFAFNLQLWYFIIPCGYYAAIRIWGNMWLRSHYNLRII